MIGLVREDGSHLQSLEGCLITCDHVDNTVQISERSGEKLFRKTVSGRDDKFHFADLSSRGGLSLVMLLGVLHNLKVRPYREESDCTIYILYA